MKRSENQNNEIIQLKAGIDIIRNETKFLMGLKKEINAKYASLTKSTGNQNQKCEYRKNKIAEIEILINKIAEKKHESELLKIEIARIKS
jgi:hypothetical protein